ncbi:MAG: TIGR04076 family protein [Actinomycetota bacterium]|nr:TIGR04076 family protein [Actinomycetota bacterium]
MVKNTTVEVIEVRGSGCAQGLKVGDIFNMEETHCDFCSWAHTAIFPFVQTLKYGGSFPWENEDGTAIACCPDAYNTVVFKITAK